LAGRRADVETGQISDDPQDVAPLAAVARDRPGGVTRWADQRGPISLAGFGYRVGPSFAAELVEAVVTGRLVHIFHRQVLVATHVQRRPAHSDTETTTVRSASSPPPRRRRVGGSHGRRPRVDQLRRGQESGREV
jgi:hypothetical protein